MKPPHNGFPAESLAEGFAGQSLVELFEANLSGANLGHAQLRAGNLSHANLERADVAPGQISREVTLELEGTTMPDGTKHE